MGGLIEPKELPQSFKGLKGHAKFVGMTGYGALLLVGGIGLAAFALPLASRIPFAGRVFSAGASVVRPNRNSDDGFGGY